MRQNPLSLLFLFALLAILPKLADAQVERQRLDAVVEQLERKEIKRIERLTAYGPHAKNPQGAARLIRMNGNNHQKTSRPSFTSHRRPRQTGPRYKNRTAKSRPSSPPPVEYADSATEKAGRSKSRREGSRMKGKFRTYTTARRTPQS